MKHFPPSRASDIRVRILATTDLHMNAVSFDYYTDQPEPTVGFSKTATLIQGARQQALDEGALVVLLDNGDCLQGAPIGDWSADHVDEGHPLMQAFDLLEYDAIGLGNHDFGFGLTVLEKIIAQAPCPVLSSNAHRQDRPAAWQSDAILNRSIQSGLERVDLKIGVISVLPPQTAQWEAHRLNGMLRIDDILSCAQHKAHHLRQVGCDLVIALAHTGLGSGLPQANMENAAIPLAAIEGIDAIVAGHLHLTFPDDSPEDRDHVDARNGHVHGKPTVMPGAAGSHLGVIDLTLTADKDQNWRITHSQTELRKITQTEGKPSVSDHPDILQVFKKAHEQTRKRTSETVGHTDRHLHSYFSFCTQDHGLAVVAAAQAAALRPHLRDTKHAGLPVLSAVAPSKFGGRAGPRFFTDVPAGDVCLRHVADLNVFPNELFALVVTGAQIRDWLEMSASTLSQFKPGQRSELVSPDRVGHNFDVLHGLTYQINLSAPPRFNPEGTTLDPSARRVEGIQHMGRPIEDDQRFVVAVNNYRAHGGGNFNFLNNSLRISLPITPIQKTLRDYFSGTLPTDPLERAPQPFHLVSIPGAQAILNTGPKAIEHLAEIRRFDPELLGLSKSGFLQICLNL